MGERPWSLESERSVLNLCSPSDCYDDRIYLLGSIARVLEQKQNKKEPYKLNASGHSDSHRLYGCAIQKKKKLQPCKGRQGIKPPQLPIAQKKIARHGVSEQGR